MIILGFLIVIGQGSVLSPMIILYFNKMKILGISALFHDSAVAIIDEKNILSAVQEERFSRIKHDPSFPNMSIEFCLKQNNLSAKDLDYVIFYDKPLLKFERLLKHT